MAQVTGIVKVAIDGTVQRSEIGAKLDLGGFQRKAVVGFRVYGYTNEVMPSRVEFVLRHTSADDLIALKDKVSSSVQFQCDSGPVFTVTNAFITKTLTLEGGDGKVAVEMMGDPVDAVS